MPTGSDRGPGSELRAPEFCLGRPPATGPRSRRSGALCPVPCARSSESGFTLAAMLVIMAIMAIFLTVAVESASFQEKREKESELIFRGNQAVEAIRLFRARFGRFPVTLEELVKANPRVLRKVWTDPMTGKTDWIPVYLGEEGTTVQRLPGGVTPPPQPTPAPGAPNPTTARGGPIIGVRSRDCAEAIRVYHGHTRYCDWKFFYDPSKRLPAITPGG